MTRDVTCRFLWRGRTDEGGLLWNVSGPFRYFEICQKHKNGHILEMRGAQTFVDCFIRSHASPYKTVGEFFEKSSEVRE